ncbi:hypothetical protein ONE63_008202 [Megalurothrips usitatus]|uniref:Galectin n=1 Tax=Megalurothrips usitatus TaxID=439358 RepID=A0AAV7XKF3_9NEOP|nr:hypothetical protein ONE63_008202 [Megalurothrips usitatus]
MHDAFTQLLAITCVVTHFQGPFIAYVDKLTVCDYGNGTDYRHYLQVKITHFNPLKPFEPQIWNGNFTNPEEVNDNNKVRVRMDVRNNNQWKENAFIFNFPKDGCSNAKKHMPTDFLRFFSKGSRCAIPKVRPYTQE